MNEPLLMNGQEVSKAIKAKLEGDVATLRNQGVIPKLVTVLVGDDLSSHTYVRMKANACERIGIVSEQVLLPTETSTTDLIQTIQRLNEDNSVHGILLQHPVPSHIDERLAFDTITLSKDVDGVTSQGFGSTAFQLNAYPCCTPAAIMKMLDYYDIDVEGKHAVVIGRSPILGKPVSMMLLNRHATVTVSHSKTERLGDIVQQADIVVAAVGKPNFVQGEWLKPGAIVLDAGYNKGNVGDCDYETCYQQASAITPVPGGVGPVTIAILLRNTVIAAQNLTR
ncbi:methylenetetrahydrofolate dehydrogenase (NADP+)/methenyltetrahydrofolate cyclohydrolase [Alkalibacillus flavidus]|uniref:Bifunctional protein FolD n=1 Tax=Alkalibacillus flavidus TaxID=546021 RepID=A0ABV2KXZ8_9BACI